MAQNQDILTASGTWNPPVGVVSVNFVECWGAGASGGATHVTRASGGGGGAYSKKAIGAISPGVGITVQVGTGGVGVSGTSAETAGNVGGDSWFNTSGTVLAKGGSPGQFGGSAASAGGGDSASGIGDTKFSGGASGLCDSGSSTGGGGAAGDANAGGNSTNNSLTGGTGGVASGGSGSNGANSGTTTSAGSVRGGGSGGSNGGTTPASGNGGRGEVRVTYPLYFVALDTITGVESTKGYYSITAKDIVTGLETTNFSRASWQNQSESSAPSWSNQSES